MLTPGFLLGDPSSDEGFFFPLMCFLERRTQIRPPYDEKNFLSESVRIGLENASDVDTRTLPVVSRFS
jgi:hypothetical protein